MKDEIDADHSVMLRVMVSMGGHRQYVVTIAVRAASDESDDSGDGNERSHGHEYPDESAGRAPSVVREGGGGHGCEVSSQ